MNKPIFFREHPQKWSGMVGFQSIELIPCHLISSIRYTDIRVHQCMARQYKHVGEQRALKSQCIAVVSSTFGILCIIGCCEIHRLARWLQTPAKPKDLKNPYFFGHDHISHLFPGVHSGGWCKRSTVALLLHRSTLSLDTLCNRFSTLQFLPLFLFFLVFNLFPHRTFDEHSSLRTCNITPETKLRLIKAVACFFPQFF